MHTKFHQLANFLLAFLAACLFPCSLNAQEALSLMHDGYQRTFLGQVPAGLSKQKPVLLVFVFRIVCRDFDATEEIWKFFRDHSNR
jgi:poly(3-hydroxybutyrate) depolymerase